MALSKPGEKIYFAAMTVKLSMDFLGAKVPIQGADGYLPVFESMDAAKEAHPGIRVVKVRIKDNTPGV